MWDKVSNTMQKEFDSKRMCNKKYLKTETKSCDGKININFFETCIPKKVLIAFIYQ